MTAHFGKSRAGESARQEQRRVAYISTLNIFTISAPAFTATFSSFYVCVGVGAHTHTQRNTNTCMQKYFSAEYVCVSVFGAEISVKAASLQLSGVLGALPLLFPLLHLPPLILLPALPRRLCH